MHPESAVAVEGDLNLVTVIGLPPLFNDDFDALQFNNIFHGGTEEDLNEFFADIFSTPTYARAGYESPPATVVSPLQSLVGAYTSDDDVLRSYYRFLHPAFPILPPPVDGMMENVSDSMPPTNSYSPSSPYMCICNASIVNCKSPAEMIDISKVTIPYPTIAGSSEIWEQIIRAEETLVGATLLLVALVKGFNSETAAQSLHDHIRTMNDIIVHLLDDSEQDGDHRTPRVEGSESKLADCFRTTARIRLNSCIDIGP
ncbi:hypothetical protein CGCF413_v001659 [Colletotrichum fructicola]|nr:hypothetical protein CGCF413_v001659 [Colletotrichum fructicola]